MLFACGWLPLDCGFGLRRFIAALVLVPIRSAWTLVPAPNRKVGPSTNPDKGGVETPRSKGGWTNPLSTPTIHRQRPHARAHSPGGPLRCGTRLSRYCLSLDAHSGGDYGRRRDD